MSRQEIDRRGFLKKAVLLTGAVAASTALSSSRREITADTSWKDEWRKINPGDRLRKLEQRRFPEFGGFSLVPEISLAAAELRCQLTTCRKTIEEMTNAVRLLSHDDFARAYEQDNGMKLSEFSDDQGITIEFAAGRPPRLIYLNKDGIKTATIKSIAPNIRAALAQNHIDPEITLTKQTTIHAQSHLNQSTENHTFSTPIDVRMPYSTQRVRVLGVDSFFLKILAPDKSPATVEGLSETLTETTTEFLCKRAGAYVQIAPYRYGVDLLSPLAKIAKIDTEELLQVYHEQRSVFELFQRLGSIPRGYNALEKSTDATTMGINVLTILGLTADQIIPMEISKRHLEAIYGLKIYTN